MFPFQEPVTKFSRTDRIQCNLQLPYVLLYLQKVFLLSGRCGKFEIETITEIRSVPILKDQIYFKKVLLAVNRGCSFGNRG